jgi:hypothetical protein
VGLSGRLRLIDTLIDEGSFKSAESQLKSLRDLEKAETEKFGPIDIVIQNMTDGTENRLTAARNHEWPATLPTVLGIRDWVPGIITQILRLLVYAFFVLVLWRGLCLLRDLRRYLGWRNVTGTIQWQVSSIADETKQLGAGAVMDALNVFHNPLFQPLKTSSLLATPPALADVSGSADPSFLVWRNFLIDSSALPTGIRPYISTLIEEIEVDKFTRHRFQQVDAFEDINLKLGIIEASLGAVVRNVHRWWTKGWPTVTGSVVIEKVAEASFASVRLICNYDLSGWHQKKLAPEDADVSPAELFNGERTMAVFASTRQDEFSDAVALASQRAAFRLLYRLAKRPADPNLAITASSYRQGLRLLSSSL